jgi:sulfide:quinone oxidoreductase
MTTGLTRRLRDRGQHSHRPRCRQTSPRAGVFAHAHAVADTVSAAISGKLQSTEFDGHGGCFIESGAGRAAYGAGNFYADPAPSISLHTPGRRWHWGKMLFEQRVMRRWL